MKMSFVYTQFVELHVLYVPDDQWDVKLNKVPAEAIERFISAGFIRCVLDSCIHWNARCPVIVDFEQSAVRGVCASALQKITDI